MPMKMSSDKMITEAASRKFAQYIELKRDEIAAGARLVTNLIVGNIKDLIVTRWADMVNAEMTDIDFVWLATR
jgi:hypothetical protein